MSEEKLNRNWRVPALTLLAALGTVLIALVVWANLAAGEGETGTEQIAINQAFSSLKPATDETSNATIEEMMSMLSMSSAVGKSPELRAAAEVVSPAGNEITLAQIDDQVCLSESSEGLGSCGNTEEVRVAGTFVALPKSCSEVRVVGLLPDGTSELSVDTPKGGATIPVADNVYDVLLPAKDLTAWSDDAPLSIDLPLGKYASMAGGCGR